jgi:hypothetical protein
MTFLPYKTGIKTRFIQTRTDLRLTNSRTPGTILSTKEMTTPPTILDLKLSFLRSQVQALSQPLTLPLNYHPASEENALRQISIDAALLKLNEAIKKHSKLVYSSQAQRHVAEQIDRLYWQAGEQDVGTGEGLERGADLSEIPIRVRHLV